jgi:hypothetical protein
VRRRSTKIPIPPLMKAVRKKLWRSAKKEATAKEALVLEHTPSIQPLLVAEAPATDVIVDQLLPPPPPEPPLRRRDASQAPPATRRSWHEEVMEAAAADIQAAQAEADAEARAIGRAAASNALNLALLEDADNLSAESSVAAVARWLFVLPMVLALIGIVVIRGDH